MATAAVTATRLDSVISAIDELAAATRGVRSIWTKSRWVPIFLKGPIFLKEDAR